MTRLALAVATTLLALSAGRAPAQQELPGPLGTVAFEQRLGAQAPLDAHFRDERGASVPLDAYFGERPVVLALVYYDCPMLCSMILNGLTSSLKTLRFDAGREFEVVVASFDPRETPAQAAETRQTFFTNYARPDTAAGWHFLTGDESSITRLTDAVGFRYTFDEESGQFAHAAGIVVLTPQGRVARYFFGVEYSPRDLRLGMVEAADEKIGNAVDQVLLYCFRYDPTTGRYSAVTMNLVRVAGVATVLVLLTFLTFSLRRERRLANR